MPPFKPQLLKWVGNKQKVAHEIIRWFPTDYDTYVEPFLGSGAVMATLAPARALGSDVFAPLMEIWATLSRDPERVKHWYRTRYDTCAGHGRRPGYEAIRAAYNARPNGADLLYVSRACYGGVVRFRKKDGHMSTPCGSHPPMKPERFDRRVDLWHDRLAGARFLRQDFRVTMAEARAGDLVYCDPPYSDSQSILYGAQTFDLADLFETVRACKARGVRVALSIDGSKKSGRHLCAIDLPPGLFEEEIRIGLGRSMLRRFQMGGRTLESEEVHDRLLLTSRL
jgi:DNA adenine methylase